jgi:ubiquinone/menaquinone biosynthesis C-methylase UbiE
VAFAYDGVLELADRLKLGSEGRVRREVIARLGSATSARVLDLGCGTCANRAHLPSDIYYVGVDLSRGMLRRAAAKFPSAALVQADAGALPFAGDAFDLIVAMGVFQHVTPIGRAVEQLRRVSSNGSRILVADELHSRARISKEFRRDNVLLSTKGDYFVLDLVN